MSQLISESLLDNVRDIAEAAGQAILTVYDRQDVGTQFKEDKTPVTDADFAAHRLIKARLTEATPEIPILSEEETDGFAPPDDGCYWLVDPLDGTREFLKRNGEFTVNIALIDKGIPVLGVVSSPVLQLTYSGAQSLGAWCHNRKDGRVDKIQVDSSRMQAWHDNTPAEPLRVLTSRSHINDETKAWLERLPEHETVAIGSSLKFCLLAEGEADLYPRLGPTSIWDTAAADAMLRGAGGWVYTLDEHGIHLPLDYSQPLQTLNPWFIAGCGPLPRV